MPKKKRPKTQKLGSVCTQEPIDANGLRAVACRKAAAHVCWPGSNVDVRTVLLSTIARAQGDHADLHQLAVEWQESAADYGFPTRRWSAQSLFALPRLLKAAGRCGLHNAVDVDQENCHFHAQLARHPGRAALVQYVRERDAKLQEVQTMLKVGRGDAKQLFLVICYHGCVEKWCRERGLASDALPPFVAEFAEEQALILQVDACQHPDLLAKIKASGAERPEVTLQSHLNMKHERLVLDAMAAAARGLAEVGSYEHDGLWLYTRGRRRRGGLAAAAAPAHTSSRRGAGEH